MNSADYHMKGHDIDRNYKHNVLVIGIVLFATIVVVVIALLMSGSGVSSEQAAEQQEIERLHQEVKRLRLEIDAAEQARKTK